MRSNLLRIFFVAALSSCTENHPPVAPVNPPEAKREPTKAASATEMENRAQMIANSLQTITLKEYNREVWRLAESSNDTAILAMKLALRQLEKDFSDATPSVQEIEKLDTKTDRDGIRESTAQWGDAFTKLHVLCGVLILTGRENAEREVDTARVRFGQRFGNSPVGRIALSGLNDTIDNAKIDHQKNGITSQDYGRGALNGQGD